MEGGKRFVVGGGRRCNAMRCSVVDLFDKGAQSRGVGYARQWTNPSLLVTKGANESAITGGLKVGACALLLGTQASMLQQKAPHVAGLFVGKERCGQRTLRRWEMTLSLMVMLTM